MPYPNHLTSISASTMNTKRQQQLSRDLMHHSPAQPRHARCRKTPAEPPRVALCQRKRRHRPHHTPGRSSWNESVHVKGRIAPLASNCSSPQYVGSLATR